MEELIKAAGFTFYSRCHNACAGTLLIKYKKGGYEIQILPKRGTYQVLLNRTTVKRGRERDLQEYLNQIAA